MMGRKKGKSLTCTAHYLLIMVETVLALAYMASIGTGSLVFVDDSTANGSG